eukprot:UN31022
MVIYPYEVIGRTVPTERDPAPKIFKAKVYAANDVVAKSRFFKYMRFNREANRAKKSTIQILRVQRKGQEYGGRAKTYGFCLNYQSRTHRVGMYKEIRATTETEAVNKLIADMAGRHRAKSSSIQITTCREVPKSKTRRLINKQLTKEMLSFRYPCNVVPVPREFKSKFALRNNVKTRNLEY